MRPASHSRRRCSCPAGTSATTGVIGSSADADVFSLWAAAGPLLVIANVVPAQGTFGRANLDVLLRLSDASGTVLATADTIRTGTWLGLPALMRATLPATGTYYISVHSTGAANPLSTGYSAYGSLGQYGIKANFTAGPSQGHRHR